jgi:hypothetical protein
LDGVLVLIVKLPNIGYPRFVGSFDVSKYLGDVLTEYWPRGSGVDLEGIE